MLHEAQSSYSPMTQIYNVIHYIISIVDYLVVSTVVFNFITRLKINNLLGLEHLSVMINYRLQAGHVRNI